MAARAGSVRAKSAATINSRRRYFGWSPNSLSAPSAISQAAASMAAHELSGRRPAEKECLDLGSRRPRRLAGDPALSDLFRRRLHPGPLQQREFQHRDRRWRTGRRDLELRKPITAGSSAAASNMRSTGCRFRLVPQDRISLFAVRRQWHERSIDRLCFRRPRTGAALNSQKPRR